MARALEIVEADLPGAWFLRASVAHAAGLTGDRAQVPLLRKSLLSDRDPRVCQAAAGSLARLGELAPVLAAFASEEPFRRQAAVGALGRFDGTGARAALLEATRPRYRRDCINGIRPCIYVSCKHHLYLDVNPQTGSVKINFPDKEPWELEETCALDVADRGGITLEEVGEILNLTRERIRQVEVNGLRKIQINTGISDVSGLLDQ